MTDPNTHNAWLEAGDGKTWPLESSIAVGRSPTNQLHLKDRKVSRRHAVIHRQDGDEFWIVDLGSGNGTYVNGMRVSLPRQLKPNDELSFGDFKVRFRQSTETGETSQTTIIPQLTEIEVKPVKCWMLLADIINSTALARKHDQAAWASRVGSWTGNCQQIVERHGGAINKYLGDGFLAIWPWQDDQNEQIAGALDALITLQDASDVPFRLAVHAGELITGGGPTLGEDNLTGFELILLFRMEKLAASIEQSTLFSQAAHDGLAGNLSLISVGDHSVPGYVDDHPRTFFGRNL